MFTPNLILHIFSDLFDYLNRASHLSQKFRCPSFAFFKIKTTPKILQNLFHSKPNNPNNLKKRRVKESKALIVGSGV